MIGSGLATVKTRRPSLRAMVKVWVGREIACQIISTPQFSVSRKGSDVPIFPPIPKLTIGGLDPPTQSRGGTHRARTRRAMVMVSRRTIGGRDPPTRFICWCHASNSALPPCGRACTELARSTCKGREALFRRRTDAGRGDARRTCARACNSWSSHPVPKLPVSLPVNNLPGVMVTAPSASPSENTLQTGARRG